MNGILSGMRVVEGSAFVAVPLAGMTLAQMGADVIRFDRIGGGLDAKRWPVAPDGSSLFWNGMNKGKRSVAVDMKSPRGKELVTQIITAPGEDAGMFLTNLRVRGWMDHETLSQFRSDLIMVTLMGDRHGRSAVDYTVNPSLGFPEITGAVGSSEPVAHALPAWDCIAGNLVVSSLLAAERHRLRTGHGQDVELALKDVAAAMLGHLGILADTQLDGPKRGKSGNSLYGAYGQDFLCADGQRVMVIGLTDRQWVGLVNVTGTGAQMDALATQTGLDLREEGVRWQVRDRITEILAPWFTLHRVEDFAERFDRGGVTWSVFRDFEKALAEDPDLSTDNPMFQNTEQDGLGPILTPRSPVNFSEANTPDAAAAPALGLHTEEILGDVVRLSDTEISQLFDQGVVQSPRYNAKRPAA